MLLTNNLNIDLYNVEKDEIKSKNINKSTFKHVEKSMYSDSIKDSLSEEETSPKKNVKFVTIVEKDQPK